jgi:hypothetical protein
MADDPADEDVAARDAGGLAAFRARLAAGDFDVVLGPGLKETLRSAAEQAGLDAEVGALRLALVRLLEEERDPSRLAAGIAKVAGVSVQAARLRQSADADADDLRTLLERGVAKLDAERARAEMAAKGGEP